MRGYPLPPPGYVRGYAQLFVQMVWVVTMESLCDMPMGKHRPSDGTVPQRGLCKDLFTFPVCLNDGYFNVTPVGDMNR